MKLLTGRLDRYGPWAVVTGASSGIGRAFAEQLSDEGLNVVLVARRRDALEEVSRLLQDRGGKTIVVSADLATAAGVDEVLAATADLTVGTLVAAAGFGTSGPFVSARWADEASMIAVNCTAVTAMALHFGQRMAARRGGAIILLSSLVGRQGTPFAAHYAATKAYVHVLAEGLHRELRASNVDVVAAAPGPVRTGFESRAGMTMRAAITAQDVVAPALRALGGRAVVTPAPLSKLLTWSLAALPRSMRVRMMGTIMRSMANQQPTLS